MTYHLWLAKYNCNSNLTYTVLMPLKTNEETVHMSMPNLVLVLKVAYCFIDFICIDLALKLKMFKHCTKYYINFKKNTYLNSGELLPHIFLNAISEFYSRSKVKSQVKSKS